MPSTTGRPSMLPSAVVAECPPGGRSALVGLSLLTLLAGCAHHDARGRLSRAMVGTGVAAVAVGALVAAGCTDESGDGSCAGSSDDGDVEVGLPLMAAGAALVAGGVAVRPKDPGRTGAAASTTSAPKTFSPGPRITLLRQAP